MMFGISGTKRTVRNREMSVRIGYGVQLILKIRPILKLATRLSGNPFCLITTSRLQMLIGTVVSGSFR